MVQILLVQMAKNFHMSVFKFIGSIGILGGSIILALFVFDNQPILIQSLESKTQENKPVYNKISYISIGKKDVWMMNQSHDGVEAKKDKWDRVAIVVDKSKKPMDAIFLQLPPGELEWNDKLFENKINYKVSCFMCHSNGPRVIRHDQNGNNISLKSKVKIFFWNLKIKSYGLIIENSEQLALDANLEVPFRHRQSADNEELKVKSCTVCHSGEDKWIDRNKLFRQNNISIKFMIENKIMPPPGFSISQSDAKELKKFLRGL